jgi:hypothetical protein
MQLCQRNLEVGANLRLVGVGVQILHGRDLKSFIVSKTRQMLLKSFGGEGFALRGERETLGMRALRLGGFPPHRYRGHRLLIA